MHGEHNGHKHDDVLHQHEEHVVEHEHDHYGHGCCDEPNHHHAETVVDSGVHPEGCTCADHADHSTAHNEIDHGGGCEAGVCGHMHHHDAARHIDRSGLAYAANREAAKVDAHGHESHAHEHHGDCCAMHHKEAHDHVDTGHVHDETCGHMTPSEARTHIDRSNIVNPNEIGVHESGVERHIAIDELERQTADAAMKHEPSLDVGTGGSEVPDGVQPGKVTLIEHIGQAVESPMPETSDGPVQMTTDTEAMPPSSHELAMDIVPFNTAEIIDRPYLVDVNMPGDVSSNLERGADVYPPEQTDGVFDEIEPLYDEIPMCGEPLDITDGMILEVRDFHDDMSEAASDEGNAAPASIFSETQEEPGWLSFPTIPLMEQLAETGTSEVGRDIRIERLIASLEHIEAVDAVSGQRSRAELYVLVQDIVADDELIASFTPFEREELGRAVDEMNVPILIARFERLFELRRAGTYSEGWTVRAGSVGHVTTYSGTIGAYILRLLGAIRQRGLTAVA